MFLPLMLLIITEINTKQVRRIYKGYRDFNNEYPFVVALESKVDNTYVRYCTGNLIEENLVITAAHCLQKPDYYHLRRLINANHFGGKYCVSSYTSSTLRRIRPTKLDNCQRHRINQD